MGNAFHQLRRGVGELKESMRLSDAFRSVQQRKGDYYINTFIATFGVSMGVVNRHLFRTFTHMRWSIRLNLATWPIEEMSMSP
jgi:hypothetical protein